MFACSFLASCFSPLDELHRHPFYRHSSYETDRTLWCVGADDIAACRSSCRPRMLASLPFRRELYAANDRASNGSHGQHAAAVASRQDSIESGTVYYSTSGAEEGGVDHKDSCRSLSYISMRRVLTSDNYVREQYSS